MSLTKCANLVRFFFFVCYMQISMNVGVMTPTTVMREHSALTQWGVTPAPVTLATLEMESAVQVRCCCISEVWTSTCI